MIRGNSRCLSPKYPICSRKSTHALYHRPPKVLIVEPVISLPFTFLCNELGEQRYRGLRNSVWNSCWERSNTYHCRDVVDAAYDWPAIHLRASLVGRKADFSLMFIIKSHSWTVTSLSGFRGRYPPTVLTTMCMFRDSTTMESRRRCPATSSVASVRINLTISRGAAVGCTLPFDLYVAQTLQPSLASRCVIDEPSLLPCRQESVRLCQSAALASSTRWPFFVMRKFTNLVNLMRATTVKRAPNAATTEDPAGKSNCTEQ